MNYIEINGNFSLYAQDVLKTYKIILVLTCFIKKNTLILKQTVA